MSPTKGVYNPKAFILHAASLHQGFPHCAIFPTAASRRSLDRISVPVWPIDLSVRLPVAGLVEPLPHQLPDRPQAHPSANKSFSHKHPCPWSYAVLAQVSLCCPPLKGKLPTCYSPVRHLSNDCIATPIKPVRLACVKHAASVRSEPGSNSHFNPVKNEKTSKTF